MSIEEGVGRSVPEGISSATSIEPVPVSPVPASIPSAVTVWRDAYVAVYGCEPTHPVAAYQGAYDVIERATSAVTAPLREALEEFVREYAGFEDGDGNPCPTVARALAALSPSYPMENYNGE